MATTIITNFLGAFEYEPEIISDTSRDGITAFQFKVIGKLSNLNNVFQPDEIINGVPDQPPGNFRVVRRSMEHIAGDPQDGLYRLSISGEGGTGNKALFISETSYAMQTQQTQGVINLPLSQIPIQYNLIWLYPSATITTNSQDASPSGAEQLAKQIVEGLTPTIIKDRPNPPAGPVAGTVLAGNANLNKIYITGSSVEKAGGLYRIRATASKGMTIDI